MIEVVEYDEAWPALFERLRDTYAAADDARSAPQSRRRIGVGRPL